MKMVGRLRKLSHGDFELPIDRYIAAAAGVRNGCHLYCVAFRRDERSSSPLEYAPDLSIFGSPFSPHAWEHLIRVDLQISPTPGSIEEVYRAFSAAQIAIRLVDSADGIDLRGMQVCDGDRAYVRQPCTRDGAYSRELAFLTVVVEVPPHKSATTPSEDEPSAMTLRSDLRQMLDDASAQRFDPKLRESVGDLLSERIARARSPQEPVRALPKVLRVVPAIGLPLIARGAIGRDAAVLRTKLTVASVRAGNRSYLSLSLKEWEGHLWGGRNPSHPAADEAAEYAVAPFADADEKIVCWQFFSLRSHAVIEMEVTFPRGLDEFTSCEAVYRQIRATGGNVVSSYSSPRLLERRASLTLTIVFRCSDGRSDPVKCIREILHGDILQCDASRPLDYVQMANLPAEVQSRMLEKFRAPDRDRRFDIGSVVVTCARGDRGPGRALANPYEVVRPISLSRYDKLYPQTVHPVAEEIVRYLGRADPPNVALIGAHRAGKSSALKILQTLLDKEHRDRFIVISIDASVTPLDEVLLHVAYKIYGALIQHHDAFTRLARHHALLRDFLARSATPPSDEAPGGVGDAVRLDRMIALGREVVLAHIKSQGSKAASRLREASAELRMALDMFSPPDRGGAPEPTAPTSPTRVIVLVDELADGMQWGAKGLPAWRHVVESPEFASLTWIVSSTLSVQETTRYSPASNVFKEINLRPLDTSQARSLVDAMEAADQSVVVVPEATDFLLRASGRLPYLLQVMCSAVYDEVVSLRVGIVTRELCIACAKDVVVELNDYLRGEWQRLADHHKEIEAAVRKLYLSKEVAFEKDVHRRIVKGPDLSPQCQRALQRSGLSGAYPRDVLPRLAVFWLLAQSDT